jgi:hypothetical protein
MVGLAASGTLELGVSMCASTTALDMDMRMVMPVSSPADLHDADTPGEAPASRHADCPPVGDDEAPRCPFAVGGVGPCGTAVPAPSMGARFTIDTAELALELGDVARDASERALPIPLPPPRVTV